MPRNFEIEVSELLALAEAENCVESFGESLYDLYKISRSNYEVRQILIDPKYDLRFRMDCIDEIFAVSKPPKMFYDFTALLLSNNLLSKLYSIYHSYLALMLEKYNLTLVQVISAVPLSDTTREKLKVSMEKWFNQKIILKNIIDPKIYGGLVLKIPPDKIIDMSVRKKLIDMKQFIRNF